MIYNWVLIGALLFAAPHFSARAADAVKSGELKVSFQTEPTVRLPIERVTIVGQSNRFALIVPAGLKTVADSGNSSLTFTSMDGIAAITLKFKETLPPKEPALTKERVAELVKAGYPDWVVGEIFPMDIDGKSGFSVFLGGKTFAGTALERRVVFGEAGTGHVEGMLTCPKDKEAEFSAKFAELIGSLRVSSLTGTLQMMKIDSDI